MKTIRDDIPYFRVLEAIGVTTVFGKSYLFSHCLQGRITRVYKSASTSNWGFVNSYFLLAAMPYFRQMLRKSIISDMSFNPVVVEERTKLNGLCLPINIPLNKLRTLNDNLPELAIYLGNVLMLLICKCVLCDND